MSSVAFIGTKANVEAAQYVYQYLRRTYLQLWEQWRDAQGFEARDRRFRSSFYNGLANGLRAKLEAERKKVEQTMALVVVKDPKVDLAVGQYYPKLVKSYRPAPRHSSKDAYGAGYERGHQININSGVGTPEAPNQLGVRKE